MPREPVARADFDSPWKEALQHFLSPFLAFFFPDIHDGIDWAKGYESLDKELHQIARAAPSGGALADKLFKVWQRGPAKGEVWLLIHVEVQGAPEEGFPERMFRYNVRAFDRYNRTVVSLAVLTDDRPDWRPSQFAYGLWGAATGIRFLNAKLLDWRGRSGELVASPSPFAPVVLAHLRALDTRNDPEARRTSKLDLVKSLYQRGWSAEDVRQHFRIIDWLLDLPEELRHSFVNDLHAWEEVNRMPPYVTSVERHAKEIGREEGLEEGHRKGLVEAIQTTLVARFGKSAIRLMPRVRAIAEADALRSVMDLALSAKTPQEVRAALPGRRRRD